MPRQPDDDTAEPFALTFFFMRGLVKAVCMMYKLVNANFLNGIYSSFTIHPFRKMQIHRKRR